MGVVRLLAILLALPAAAATEPYLSIEGIALADHSWILYLDGPIENGADRRLARFLVRQDVKSAQVILNSPGGSLLAGIGIGRQLRERGYNTRVGRRTDDPRYPAAGACYSACPFAFAGGVERRLDPGSTLGVHRARNRVPVPDTTAFDRRVRDDATRFLGDMGVDPALFDLMQSVPDGEIRRLSRRETVRLRLVSGADAGR